MQREILDSPYKFLGHGKVKDIGVVAEHTDVRRDSHALVYAARSANWARAKPSANKKDLLLADARPHTGKEAGDQHGHLGGA